MDRQRIRHQGSETLNGNDAYAVLGVMFDWIEANEEKLVDVSADLLNELRKLGYCICTTEFGCVACKGRKSAPTHVTSTNVVNEVMNALEGFGFDEFMCGQITSALKQKDLLQTEPHSDGMDTFLQTLDNFGYEINEIHSLVEELQSLGVVFRKRDTTPWSARLS